MKRALCPTGKSLKYTLCFKMEGFCFVHFSVKYLRWLDDFY